MGQLTGAKVLLFGDATKFYPNFFMLNGQKKVEAGAFKGEKVERWKGEKMAFKGEKVERWKGEKMAFKGENVKRWKGEKMSAPHRWTSRPNVATS